MRVLVAGSDYTREPTFGQELPGISCWLSNGAEGRTAAGSRQHRGVASGALGLVRDETSRL